MTIPISPDPPPNAPLPETEPDRPPTNPPIYIIDLPPDEPSPGIIVPDPNLPPS
jgi:hypothetical protein